MKTILVVLAFCGLTGIAVAQDDANPEIHGVIFSQIEAFRADDFPLAFTFASPVIRQIFGNPERFGQMVRQGFPMVWRPSDVRFLAQVDRDGRVYQNVLLSDTSGVFHVLEYEMVMAGDAWQINGVRLLPAPEVGA